MKNIVYVEDNKLNIKLIQGLGEKLGYDIKAFEDPKEGLKYCLDNDVDLILVDYMMPGMNGIDFVKELKKTKPDIPIAMITAINEISLRKEAALNGIEAFLPKPIDFLSFKQIVIKLLNKEETKEEDNYVQDILDSQRNLIIVFENKIVKDVNKHFLHFFNYPAKEMVDNKFFRFFVIEENFAWGNNYDEFIQNVINKSHFAKMKKNNKEYIFRIIPVVHRNKNRVVLTFEDITEMEKLKEENKMLKKSKEKLEKKLQQNDLKNLGFFGRLKKLFLG